MRTLWRSCALQKVHASNGAVFSAKCNLNATSLVVDLFEGMTSCVQWWMFEKGVFCCFYIAGLENLPFVGLANQSADARQPERLGFELGLDRDDDVEPEPAEVEDDPEDEYEYGNYGYYDYDLYYYDYPAPTFGFEDTSDVASQRGALVFDLSPQSSDFDSAGSVTVEDLEEFGIPALSELEGVPGT